MKSIRASFTQVRGLLPIIFHLGTRNIVRQKKRSLFVMATAAMGMMGVLPMLGLLNGTLSSMKQGALESGLGHLQIRPEGYTTNRRPGRSFRDAETARHLVRNVPWPASARLAARFEREGLLRLGSYTAGVLLMGIEPDDERWVSAYDDWLIRGNYFERSDTHLIPCIIGSSSARRMEVDVGDSVVLSTGDHNGDTASVRAIIVGIFESPIPPLNRSVVLLPRDRLSTLYDGSPDHIGGFIALFHQESEMSAGADASRAALTGVPDMEVLTFDEVHPELKAVLDLSRHYDRILSTLFLTGFALTLLNTILMSIFERMREIGIQRAIGAGAGPIVSAILLECMVLGWAGMAIGTITGSALVFITGKTGISLAPFTQSVQGIGTMSTTIYPALSVSDYASSLVVGSVMSLLAGIYPAIRAVRTPPLEAIYRR